MPVSAGRVGVEIVHQRLGRLGEPAAVLVEIAVEALLPAGLDRIVAGEDRARRAK